MSNTIKKDGERRNGAAILDEENVAPEDKAHAAHKGEQAPPNAADGGRTIAPQMGYPRTDDRQPN